MFYEIQYSTVENKKITVAMALALGPARLSLRMAATQQQHLGAGVAMCAILNMFRDSGVYSWTRQSLP